MEEDKEHYTLALTKDLSEFMTALNSLNLITFRLSEIGLTEEYRQKYHKAVDQMLSLGCELIIDYEKETGQFVDFMEGWGFRSEWTKEFNDVQS